MAFDVTKSGSDVLVQGQAPPMLATLKMEGVQPLSRSFILPLCMEVSQESGHLDPQLGNAPEPYL